MKENQPQQGKKRFLPPNVKELSLPILFLIILVVLWVVVVRVGFSRVSLQRQEIAAAKRNENVLAQKESLLREVEDSLSGAVDLSAAAVPSKNPALYVSSHIKNIALVNGVFLSNVKVGGEVSDKSGLSRVDIGFDIDGGMQEVVSFLRSLKTIAPISKIEKVRISQTGDVARASVVVKSFWSKFPEKLPALTDQISDFTNEEREIIARISSLSLPSFFELDPLPASGRSDPFN